MGKKLFRGGVHPHDEKERTASLPVVDAGLPERLFLPVSQHIGAPAKPIVTKGDKVLGGQVVAEAAGFVSVPIHASTSGTVRSVAPYAHPLGAEQLAIEIEVDGEDTFVEAEGPMEPIADPFNHDPNEIKTRILAAGIVGMGGATFPTHVKLSPPPEIGIDTIILNGVECEPFLTADHRLMLDRPDDIINGLKVILAIFGLDSGFIGIEKNKPDPIALMQDKAASLGGVEVKPLEVRYPQGAEKQLIHAISGRDVPSAALPMAVGTVVQNVATAVAIWEAVTQGKPLTSRICTVTGDGVKEPKNLLIRTGTPIGYLIEQCGGLTDDIAKVIMGGPMMGLSQYTLDVPSTKGTSGLLCLPASQVRTEPQKSCISCGRCVSSCPMGLSPTTIYNFIDADRVAEADEWDTLDCIECASCSYVCPAGIPLVQYIRYAKGRVLARRRQLGT